MSGAFYIGAVGLESQQQALDIIANNIANLNTPAFKRSQVRFSEVMASQADIAQEPQTDQAELMRPAGAVARSEFMMMEQGDLRRTGKPLDIAIEGSGYIELLGPSGQSYLWRGGTLKITEEGLLAAANNMPLRSLISLPDNVTAVSIDSDGKVRGSVADEKGEIDFGQISLVRVKDAAGIGRIDGGLYVVPPEMRLSEYAPGEDGMGLIVQGAVEASNVELTEEMVQLTLVQRSFAANAQVIQAADQLMGISNSLRR